MTYFKVYMSSFLAFCTFLRCRNLLRAAFPRAFGLEGKRPAAFDAKSLIGYNSFDASCAWESDRLKKAAMGYELIDHRDMPGISCFVVSINHRLMHFHNEIEILYMLEGSVQIERRGQTIRLEKGEIFLLERNIAHSLKHTGGENQILTLQFDAGFCSAVYPRLSRLRFTDFLLTCKDGRAYRKLKEALFYIVRCHKVRTEGYPFRIMMALNAICCCLVEELHAEELSDGLLAQEERGAARLNRVMDYVGGNYMHRVKLGDLAEREGLSMCYLSHFIKDKLGMSFQQYLNKVRVKNAESLIVQTDKRAIDICFESGFSDYRYLSKAFVEEYGCTPSEYRRANPVKRLPDRDPDLKKQHVVIPIDMAVKDILLRFDS